MAIVESQLSRLTKEIAVSVNVSNVQSWEQHGPHCMRFMYGFSTMYLFPLHLMRIF
jgi:hypothetical protein